jgi:hypothetical protein
MRVALGRIALLLGVVVVGAMAWYGATSLFAEDDEPSAPDSSCVAVARRSEANDARRDFLRKYGDARWFRDAGVVRTADGFVLRVKYRTVRRPAALPECQSTVPVVAVRGRSAAA